MMRALGMVALATAIVTSGGAVAITLVGCDVIELCWVRCSGVNSHVLNPPCSKLHVCNLIVGMWLEEQEKSL